MKRSLPGRFALILAVAVCAVLAGGASRIVQDQCGPFTDVTPGFCPYILEIYYLGVTVGTSATTFSPDEPLTRGQGAVFVAKGLDQALARSSPRAALGQWWTTTPPYQSNLGVTSVGDHPVGIVSDGADVWVANQQGGTVSRVRASDGRLLETWTGPLFPTGILAAMGRILVTDANVPGALWMIDPSQPPGAMTLVASDLGGTPTAMTFDGARIFTANQGSVSIVTPGASPPWQVTTVTEGFTTMAGAVFDGTNVWVSDYQMGKILRLDPNGVVLQTVTVGQGAAYPVFDGANIWVPVVFGDSVAVVRASDGAVLTTLTGVGDSPFSAAFDGQRILVASYLSATVSLWKAADFSPLGTFSTGGANYPFVVCSDGQGNFWVTLAEDDRIGRF